MRSFIGEFRKLGNLYKPWSSSGGGSEIISGIPPITTSKHKLLSLKAFGGTEQNGTPTPDTPIDIVCNNGVLKARHQSGLPLGYTLLDYIESTGTQYIDLGYLIDGTMSFHLKSRCLNTGFVFGSRTNNITNVSSLNYDSVGNLFGIRMGNTILYNSTNWTENTDYEIYISDGDTKINGTTVSTTAYGTSFYSGNAYLFTINNDGVPGSSSFSINRIYYFQMLKNGVLTQNLIPCRRNSDNELGMYDTVSGQFFTNAGTGDFVAGNPVNDPVEIYADGTVETIQVQGNNLLNTATAEMLLKVGTYQDVQSILDGVVTRNVEVKVLDGTENWSATYLNYYSIPLFGHIPSAFAFSNIAKGVSTGVIPKFGNSRNDTIWLGSDWLGIGTTEYFATIADWKAYLVDQYNAGTPVIVVYPLETPITEQVAGQTLALTRGNNIIDITQASLDNLELEVEVK